MVLLGVDILLAQRLIQANGRSASSPVYSNQWRKEVATIHNLSLAAWQHRVIDHAVPPDGTTQPCANSLQFLAQRALNTTFGQICRTIQVRSTAHISFSRLDLATIIII
jgi:hypothetical protein